MSRPTPSNPRSPRKCPADRPRSARWVKREGIRLGAALLIFALCYVGARWVPAVKAQAEPFLRNILSCSCDFEEAVRCFSTQMEQGGGVQDALEDFCVTAFHQHIHQPARGLLALPQRPELEPHPVTRWG